MLIIKNRSTTRSQGSPGSPRTRARARARASYDARILEMVHRLRSRMVTYAWGIRFLFDDDSRVERAWKAKMLKICQTSYFHMFSSGKQLFTAVVSSRLTTIESFPVHGRTGRVFLRKMRDIDCFNSELLRRLRTGRLVDEEKEDALGRGCVPRANKSAGYMNGTMCTKPVLSAVSIPDRRGKKTRARARLVGKRAPF